MKTIMRFLHDDEGVTAIEYALIAALIAVAIIAAVQVLSTSISDTFKSVSDTLTAAV